MNIRRAMTDFCILPYYHGLSTFWHSREDEPYDEMLETPLPLETAGHITVIYFLPCPFLLSTFRSTFALFPPTHTRYNLHVPPS